MRSGCGAEPDGCVQGWKLVTSWRLCGVLHTWVPQLVSGHERVWWHLSFHHFPPLRPPHPTHHNNTQAHLRNKTTATWESLETRVAGKDEDYRGVVVLPFIATVARQPPDSPSAQLIQELFDDLIDRSVQLPGLVRSGPLIPLLRVCLPKGVARGPWF